VIVLDASAVIELLLNRSPTGLEVARRIAADSRGLLAPCLLDAEVGQVLRRFTRDGSITPERAAAALEDYGDLPITRYPHLPLLARAFEMRDNATFYDGLYLALAEAAGAPLLTADRRLAGVPGVAAGVEVLAG
jgi:predicted nucleic acid-binding protein